MLSGKFSKEYVEKVDNLPLIRRADCFYNVGILCLREKEHCDESGNYNCNDWIIEKGEIENAAAFRVHPAEHLPTLTYLTFKHCLVVKFGSK